MSLLPNSIRGFFELSSLDEQCFRPAVIGCSRRKFYGDMLDDCAFITVFVLVQGHYVVGLRDQAAGEAAEA